MKVVFHEDFYGVYALEPAGAAGRMEAVIRSLGDRFAFVQAVVAKPEDIAAVHGAKHIDYVRSQGLYEIAALAAGGAVQAATLGLKEPAFALIRPPGHHASQDDAWGFCYFNNMSVALKRLLAAGQIKTAAVLDFDLHYGDGNVNILSETGVVDLFNPEARDRQVYLEKVTTFLENVNADIIGISAGFDNHKEDWGGLLATEDYQLMGRLVKEAAKRTKAGYFGILEGGYNHNVLGQNVAALLEGMS